MKPPFFLPPKLASHTIGPNPVRGHYIYEWRDCNKTFYVGSGTNRRAWNDHLPLPENRRRLATRFTVVIVRHNLTKKQAHLFERLHIAAKLRQGCVLLNGRIPRT